MRKLIYFFLNLNTITFKDRIELYKEPCLHKG